MDTEKNHTPLFQEVARMLGASANAWRDADGDTIRQGVVIITMPGGLSIFSETVWNQKDRVKFSVDYPRELRKHTDSRDDSPKITVSDTRTAEAIAKDLERRFIPQAEAVLAKVRERKAAADTATTRQAEVVKQLEATGVLSAYNACNFTSQGDNPRLHDARPYDTRKGAISASVTYAGEVKLEIDWITPELAVKVLEVLKGA